MSIPHLSLQNLSKTKYIEAKIGYRVEGRPFESIHQKRHLYELQLG